MKDYICKIATLEEVIEKADYEIEVHPGNRVWELFKEIAIYNTKEGNVLTYIGKLDEKIICEASAIIKEEGFKDNIGDSSGLMDKDMCYLFGFRTNKEYRGQGYFSKLLNFIEEDLKSKGYKKLAVGVEPKEVNNLLIYLNKGFTNYIKTSIEYLPSKKENEIEEMIVNFYYKDI